MGFLQPSLITAHDEDKFMIGMIYHNVRMIVFKFDNPAFSVYPAKRIDSLEFIFCFPDKAVEHIMRSLW